MRQIIRQIVIGACCVMVLYIYKILTVNYFFHYACRLIPESNHETTQQYGQLILRVKDLFTISVLYWMFVQRNWMLQKLRLLIYVLLVSPLVFDILDIFRDKSCFKAWINFSKLWWYIPMALPVWILIMDIMFRHRKEFSKADYLLVGMAFIIYHFIKPY